MKLHFELVWPPFESRADACIRGLMYTKLGTFTNPCYLCMWGDVFVYIFCMKWEPSFWCSRYVIRNHHLPTTLFTAFLLSCDWFPGRTHFITGKQTNKQKNENENLRHLYFIEAALIKANQSVGFALLFQLVITGSNEHRLERREKRDFHSGGSKGAEKRVFHLHIRMVLIENQHAAAAVCCFAPRNLNREIISVYKLLQIIDPIMNPELPNLYFCRVKKRNGLLLFLQIIDFSPSFGFIALLLNTKSSCVLDYSMELSRIHGKTMATVKEENINSTEIYFSCESN